MSDTTDRTEASRGVDAETGNWLARNLWMVKGLLTAAVLTGVGFASLAVLDHEMANVLWAIMITLAALVVLVEVVFGAFQTVNSA